MDAPIENQKLTSLRTIHAICLYLRPSINAVIVLAAAFAATMVVMERSRNCPFDSNCVPEPRLVYDAKINAQLEVSPIWSLEAAAPQSPDASKMSDSLAPILASTKVRQRKIRRIALRIRVVNNSDRWFNGLTVRARFLHGTKSVDETEFNLTDRVIAPRDTTFLATEGIDGTTDSLDIDAIQLKTVRTWLQPKNHPI